MIVIFVNHAGLMDVWILQLLNFFFHKNYDGAYYMCIIFVPEKSKVRWHTLDFIAQCFAQQCKILRS